jgi:Pentapeptide repeats (8 copies)
MAGRFRPRRRGLVALSSAAGLLAVGWLATTPWLVDHWPRVLALGLVLLVLVDRLKLQNDVRTGLLQAVAAVAVIAVVAVTWQQLETGRRQLRQQLEVTGAEQAAARFAQALDQLGSEQLDVRLGGIYGLERVAAKAATQTNGWSGYRGPGGSPSGGMRGAPPPASVWWGAEDRAQVFEILSAYVRTSSHRPPVGPATATALQVRQPDVHAAVSVLARRTELAGDPPLDLSGSVLPQARLGWARLAGADLRGADLRGTSLQHADLVGVHLEQALLCGTQLQGADLRGAHLAGARVSGDTSWPDGFDWRGAGARMVGSC